MNKKSLVIAMGVCAFTMLAAWATPARAQGMDETMKPAEYCYVSSWSVPRPQWADMLKLQAGEKVDMDKLMASGAITSYGNDATLVHTEDGPTHSDWMCSGNQGMLASIAASYIANPSQPAVYSASKHSDLMLESRDYGWHTGTFTDGYMRISSWKLKAGAPSDAVEQISKNFLDPIFAKLMASGAIHGYGVYTQAIHSMDPDVFWSVIAAAGPDGLNSYDKAVGDALKQNPMAGTAFDSMIDFSMHRDDLTRIINMSEK